MTNNRFTKPIRILRHVITSLWVICAATSPGADGQILFLKSGTVTYSNVTVYSQTEQDLYISHAHGLGNIKINSLDDDSLRALGLKDAEPESASGTIMANARGVSEKMGKLKISLAAGDWKSLQEWFGKLKETSQAKLTPKILGIVIAVGALFYLLGCCCLKLICLNAGAPPGVMIWVPVLQIFPLLRAAKMSGWCFLFFLVPLVNVIMHIWWSFRIAKACGKGTLVAIALILPGINLFAFLYLACSKGPPPETAPARPVRLEGLVNA